MIYEDLPVGPANGVTGAELIKRYGMASSRELQKEIQRERLSGRPILNRGNKYFRSEDPLDFKLWGRTTSRKGKNTLRTVGAVMAMCPDTSGQISLDDYLTLEEEGADDGQEEILRSEEV